MASIKPPPANHPDPNARHDWFYMWVGLCLTRWGFVHEQLYDVCRLALRAPAKSAAIVFYKSPSFDTRLTLVDELLSAVIPQPERKSGGHPHELATEWDTIRKKLLDLSPIRNCLAHQQPQNSAEPIKIVVGQTARVHFDSTGHWMEIRLATSEAIRGRKPKVEVVRDVELPGHYQELEDAWAALVGFKERLLAMLQSG